jgi:hypothetical protein
LRLARGWETMAEMRDTLQTLMGGIESTVGPKLPIDDEVPPPFFGRGQELAVLRRAMAAVRTGGECRAITLIGAQGIGKSRLIDEFSRELRQLDDPIIRTFRASGAIGGSNWAAFVQLLTQRFGIVETNDLDEAKSSVRSQVGAVLEDRKVGDVLYLLGDLFDLEFPKSPLTKAFDESSTETTTLLKRAILKNFIEADAAFGPMCWIVDDLHLCHDQTLRMLRFLVEHLKAPVLFVCAARPELLCRADALPNAPGHTTLHLEPLTGLDSAALIGSVLTPEGMTPMHLVEKARQIAGGNPGRIEEVGRYYRDQGTLPPPPEGLEAATNARLEQLTASERLLLQKAATMGGVFWLGGLIVLDRENRDPPELWSADDEQGVRDLSDALTRLADRDYVMRLPDSTFPGDEEYVFRQRAERDRIAALTSVAEASKWHRLLADWLDSQPETRSHEEYLELLGEQREKSGAKDSAASAYLEAAGQARAHASPKRELGYYERALALFGEESRSRRLWALIRAAEMLDKVDREEEALVRYREAAQLAYRLNRRRLWENAHLSASRLAERLAARAEARRDLEAAEQRIADATALSAEPPIESSPSPEEPEYADNARDTETEELRTEDEREEAIGPVEHDAPSAHDEIPEETRTSSLADAEPAEANVEVPSVRTSDAESSDEISFDSAEENAPRGVEPAELASAHSSEAPTEVASDRGNEAPTEVAPAHVDEIEVAAHVDDVPAEAAPAAIADEVPAEATSPHAVEADNEASDDPPSDSDEPTAEHPIETVEAATTETPAETADAPTAEHPLEVDDGAIAEQPVEADAEAAVGAAAEGPREAVDPTLPKDSTDVTKPGDDPPAAEEAALCPSDAPTGFEPTPVRGIVEQTPSPEPTAVVVVGEGPDEPAAMAARNDTGA